MKIRLLIIAVMVILIITSITLTYFSRQMNVCSSSPEFLHNTRMNGVLDCLEFMSTYDPNMPDLRPSLTYDIGFFDLVFLEIISIVGGSYVILIFVNKRIRK